MTERSPHIAPVFFISMNCILNQVRSVLAGRVREAGRVQFRAADSAAVVDLNCAARRAGPVAAVGVARNHRIDVRGVFLVLVSDGSAELCRKVFIRCRQRERHGRCVDFLSLDRAAVLQHCDYDSGSLLCDEKAAHKPVCRALARCGLTKTERIKNRLDLYRVKTIAVGHSRVGFRHRRIQKGKRALHIRDVRLKLSRHGIRKVDSIERRFDRQIVVVGPTGCRGAEDRGDQDDRRKDGDEQKADALAPLFAGQQCGGDLYEHRRYCHQRPPAFPNRASLYGGAWTSSR